MLNKITIRRRLLPGKHQKQVQGPEGMFSTDESIKLYLISGFLGSGKTTLLRRLLRQSEGMRVGVLVNEFGQIGIDGRLIEQDGIVMKEINNGSIFCSCLKASFVEALVALSEQPIDVLFIENSGIADPTQMPDILETMRNRFHRPYTLCGEICVVDCTSFMDYSDVLTPIQRQIEAADVVLINKIDLSDPEERCAVKKRIRDWNDRAVVIQTEYAKLDLFRLPFCSGHHRDQRMCANAVWTRPGSFVIQADEEVTLSDALKFINQIGSVIYRAKGFARCREGVMYIEWSGNRANGYPSEVEQVADGFHLVVISKGRSDREHIEKCWNAIFDIPVSIS